jgi:photosystem II stability/assembly factor-like uncharacterized protein
MKSILRGSATFAVFAMLATTAPAQQFSPSLLGGLEWRMIGPFRGGRTVAISGVPDRPNLFFAAAVDGGVWRTEDAGRVWRPIFDGQGSGSVGAIAVFPSNPNIIYVGSGEGLQRPDLSVGDGIYKTTDGGRSWQHLGLSAGQQIGAMALDPSNPDRLFVAVLGHPYGPNLERGVYRTTNGGATFERVLYKNENTGAIDVQLDPANPNIVYAALWASRRPPWSVGNGFEAPGSGLYKSFDGGTTWTHLTAGLPTAADGLGRIGIGIAPSRPDRMYALVEARRHGGLYRSDDGGRSWVLANTERRIWGRGSDFAGVRVDPSDPDTVYVANTSTYRSSDAGRDFTAIKGAPGGDDYHSIWINPKNPGIILLGSDQGATISVDGAKTWSSWYNQPTAQFYHVITDNRFPYWVYGGQQESGSIGTASRSDYGEITFRDWHTVGTEEYGYVAPDPLNPNFIYGGKVTRYNQTTTQTQDVSPVVLRTGKYRFNRTAPLIFSCADPHVLYLGSNVLFATRDGGQNWSIVSPDLTRPNPGIPANLGIFANYDPEHGAHRGVIYSLSPSCRSAGVIWAGTDDGNIQVTRDSGKAWHNVTPPELTPWSKVAQIEAGHFDLQTAYAAVNRLRLNDLRPYIYRTHDGGRTWQLIVNGLPNDEPVNTVREDQVRRGLLFAGTERTVYVSFDDGNHWQSLQQNLPATSIRDLVVHGDDLVIGTHGRSFWILDDITPLRQLDPAVASAPAFLFKPGVAYRVRRSTNTDTPLPPEVPAGQNPPDGAIIDYTLRAAAAGPIALEISDAAGRLVRRYSSADRLQPVDPRAFNVPMYWVKPQRVLSAAAGMHRWVWDLRYQTPRVFMRDYPISAIPRDTPLAPRGPRALAGTYRVTLVADGKTYTQPLTLRMDPRVKASPTALEAQFRAETAIAGALAHSHEAADEVRSALQQIISLEPRAQGAVAGDLATTAKELEPFAGRPAFYGNIRPSGFLALNAALEMVYASVDSADAAPTAADARAERTLDAELQRESAAWQSFKTTRLSKLNSSLHSAGLPPVNPNAPPAGNGARRPME